MIAEGGRRQFAAAVVKELGLKIGQLSEQLSGTWATSGKESSEIVKGGERKNTRIHEVSHWIRRARQWREAAGKNARCADARREADSGRQLDE
jgi:hypothetical protein